MGRGALRRYGGTRETPQSKAIPGSSQVANSAGGFSWQVDDWDKLTRFLVLGTEGGTYYTREQVLTEQSAEAVRRCIKTDGARTVAEIVAISEGGRAPKNEPAIFALAMALSFGNAATKQVARLAIPKVCRIGTHLFHFATYSQQMRGWGRALKSGIADWYSADTDRLSLQVIKYRQRDGWTHRDLLRKSHAQPQSPDHNALFAWVAHSDKVDAPTPLIKAFEDAQEATGAAAIVKLITDHNLPREAIPTQWLKDASIWEALLEKMPMTAMIRNLGNMGKAGLVKVGSRASQMVVERLGNEDRLRGARVHPIQVLAALLTYEQGHGMRGSGEWDAVPQVVDALDRAFYLAFGNVQPTGKRLMLGYDVSGSMMWGDVAGIPGLTPNKASAAIGLITASVEKQSYPYAFDTGFKPLTITPRMRLDRVVKKMQEWGGGGTDCSLPMQEALKRKMEIDTFVVYTDSETWHGRMHPAQALVKYRQQMGIPAKLIVVAMTQNDFSIADPNDAGMLDVVGFDTATPQLIADFTMQPLRAVSN